MTLHRMVKRADAGEIIDQQGVDIGPDDTAEQAFRKVLPCAVEVLERQIGRLLDGSATGTPQDESLATYYGGRTPEDGRIDWSAPARRIHDLVRAVTDPYPGAFTDFGGSRLMVWQTAPVAGPSGRPGEILSLDPLIVATGDGALQLVRTEWRGATPPALVAGDVL
jgi:methionyl-tRNA formyltransferase